MFISRQSHSHVLNINDRGSWYGTNAFSGRLNSTSYRDATVYNDCSIPYSSPVLRDTSQCLFKLTPQCTAFSYVVRGVSEPHTSELNGGFFIYILLYYYIISVICIPYVSLDCNLTQPHTGCRQQVTISFSRLFSAVQRWWAETLGRSSWSIYTVQELQVVKTNMVTYRVQKIAGVFISHAALHFSMPLLIR